MIYGNSTYGNPSSECKRLKVQKGDSLSVLLQSECLTSNPNLPLFRESCLGIGNYVV